MSVFVKPLIHVWHGDRNWSKILYGTIHFTFSAFFWQSLRWIVFNCGMTIRAMSKILCSTIPIPVRDLKIKVRDFEFFVLNLQSVSYRKTFD